MCGINGVYLKDKAADPSRFNAMRDTLIHRGPDGAGTWIHENKQIAFGHRRLAFMDLSENGRQPMASRDKRIQITVNGEIYNYPELRKELEALGHIFVSESDSEVLIHAWETWGTEMSGKLNGMFAFALYDDNKKEVVIVRDRFGIKPLYYHLSEKQFAFASEIKAIISYFPGLKQIRKSSVADYFSYRYVPSPFSIYENIFKLEPGTYLKIDSNFNSEIKKYYQPGITSSNLSQKDMTENLKHLFRESVNMHTQSHVPVGSFLSGGYDSSAIVQMLAANQYKANTFSIGFKDWERSEDQYAKLVSDHFSMPHFSYKADNSDLDLLPLLMKHYDEPIADISIIPTYLVSQLAVQHNKAVLSGEGADELFSGYTWHYENMELQKWFPKLKNRVKGIQMPEAFSVEAYSRAMAMGHLRNKELSGLLSRDFADSIPEDSDWFYKKSAQDSGLNRFRLMDMRCFMGELVLTKIDRASMANSLEVRVPFLENKLVDFMLSLPPGKLYKRNYKKYQLHEIIKNDMPKEILQRNKQGFVGPDRYYEDTEWYRRHIYGAKSVKDGIIDQAELQRLLYGKEYWKLWKFVVFETWYKVWFS